MSRVFGAVFCLHTAHTLLALLLVLFLLLGVRTQRLARQNRTIIADVPVQVLGSFKGGYELFGKGRLTDLTRAGHDHHFALQVSQDEAI